MTTGKLATLVSQSWGLRLPERTLTVHRIVIVVRALQG